MRVLRGLIYPRIVRPFPHPLFFMMLPVCVCRPNRVLFSVGQIRRMVQLAYKILPGVCDFQSLHGNQRSRPQKHLNRSTTRTTLFLALTIDHHSELCDAVSALTSRPAHESAIEGFDASIVVNPRCLHVTLGIVKLATPQPSPSNHDRDHDYEVTTDLAGAVALRQPSPAYLPRAHK